MERSRIKKLGTVLHFTDLGNAIIKKPQKLPKIGSDVVTENLMHIGSIIDIFGPVASPYVSIKVKDEYKEVVKPGTKLYAIERVGYLEKRKTKRKKASRANKNQSVLRTKKKGKKKKKGD